MFRSKIVKQPDVIDSPLYPIIGSRYSPYSPLNLDSSDITNLV